jgi:predicted XRE-type DNA-binding protein
MNITEPDIQHTAPAGHSVFADLFPPEEAAELEIRADLLSELSRWLTKSGLSDSAAAERLGINVAEVAQIQQGRISGFELNILVRIATRAGMRVKLELRDAA